MPAIGVGGSDSHAFSYHQKTINYHQQNHQLIINSGSQQQFAQLDARTKSLIHCLSAIGYHFLTSSHPPLLIHIPLSCGSGGCLLDSFMGDGADKCGFGSNVHKRPTSKDLELQSDAPRIL